MILICKRKESFGDRSDRASEDGVCGRSLSGIVGFNLPGGMGICVLCVLCVASR